MSSCRAHWQAPSRRYFVLLRDGGVSEMFHKVDATIEPFCPSVCAESALSCDEGCMGKALEASDASHIVGQPVSSSVANAACARIKPMRIFLFLTWRGR
jgi:hypothetical protein